MRRLTSYMPPPAYAVIAAASLASAYAFGRVPAPSDPGTSALGVTGGAQAAALAPVLDLRPVARLEDLVPDLLSRPPMQAGRTPDPEPDPATVVAETAEKAPPAPALHYRGYVWDGDRARALLVWDGRNPEGDWLVIGDGRDGWQITAITRDHVTISNGTEELRFGMFEAE